MNRITVSTPHGMFLGVLSPIGLLALCDSGRFRHLLVQGLEDTTGTEIDGLLATSDIKRIVTEASFGFAEPQLA